MSILDYIEKIKQENEGPRITGQEPRNMYSDGQLVTPSVDGLRPGYQGNPNRTYPYTFETGEINRRLGFDTEKQKHFKKVGKATKGNPQRIIYQGAGESLEDFKLRKTERITTAVDKTVEARNYIDNWTKNWLDQNIGKYGVKDFEVMLDDLSTAWQNKVATGTVPKGKADFNLTTSKLKLPNITTKRNLKPGLTAFNYEGFNFHTNLESKDQMGRTMGQWRKMFYKNKIITTRGLQENLKNFYEFMARDKRGVYNQPGGLTKEEYYNTQVSDDAKFLLDKDASGLDKNPKKELFNSFDDIKDNYNIYTQDKQRLERIQRLAEAAKRAGPNTAGQAKLVSDRILSQNKIVAEMTPEQLLLDEKFIKSLRTVINPNTGVLSFTGYTKDDPKVKFGKKVIRNDLELAKHAIERAKNGNLFHAEHISPVASGKLNVGFPNNLQSANYITNAQIDNARRYLKNNPDTPNAKILENNFLKENNLRISGQEYVRPFGVDAPMFNPKTGTSDIVERTFIGNTQETPIKSFKDMMHELNTGKSTLAYHTLKKGNINVDDVCFTGTGKLKKASGGRIGYKSAGSVGQVCGIDFAQNKPNEFLRRISKIKGADTFLRSAAGLKAAKGLLKSGKYFANPMTLGGGEAWYSYLTFLNERGKGKSMGSSINEALWFIPGNMKRDMEMLVGYKDPRTHEVFPDMSKTHGFEAMTDDQKKQFMALKLGKNIGEINKAASSLDSAQRTLRGENPNLPIAQISPHRDLTEQEQLARDKVEYNTRKFYKDLKEKEVEGEKLFTEYSDLIKKTEGTTDVSSEQFMKPIEDVKKRIQNQVVSEWNKALPKKYMQGDPWSGPVWSGIKSWAGSTGPLGMWKIGKTAKEEEMLKNMDARERYLYNVNARGLRHLRGPEDLTWKHYEAFGLPEYARELWFNKGGRAGYMGGGIAGIRKPHAIPPESGPQSQGLASLKKYGSYY